MQSIIFMQIFSGMTDLLKCWNEMILFCETGDSYGFSLLWYDAV